MRRAVRAIVVRDGKILLIHRNKFGSEYYTLPGGGIDAGETAEQALKREVQEECGFTVLSARPIFVEEAGNPFGTQYIYLCEVEGQEPQLAPHSAEAKIHAMGQNLYTPKWVSLKELPQIQFRSEALKTTILHAQKVGYPEKPVMVDNSYVGLIRSGSGSQGD